MKSIVLGFFTCWSLAFLPALDAEENHDSVKFVIEIKMDCPMSKELKECMMSIPTYRSANFEEWKNSFVKNMTNLIYLVESGKIRSGQWSINMDESQEAYYP